MNDFKEVQELLDSSRNIDLFKAEEIICFSRTVVLNPRDEQCKQLKSKLVADFDVVNLLCKSLAVIYIDIDIGSTNDGKHIQLCAETLLSMLSYNDIQSERQILLHFVQNCSKYIIESQEIKLREVFACLFSAVCTQSVGRYLLPHFVHFFALALRGIGDFNSTIRQQCTQAFRKLVPLAPLAKQQLLSRTRQNFTINEVDNFLFSDNSNLQNTVYLLKQIFQREKIATINESTNAHDVKIMTILRGIMSSTSGDQSAYFLRQYQWEGVTWLMNLRRCGLSGILADEMGLGKRL